MPCRNRGKRCDEYIEAMRALWTEEVASYQGETVSLDQIRCAQKPVQEGGIPLIVGGHSNAAARRAGRLGDGFLPLGYQNQSDSWEFIEVMREAAEEAGRDPDAIEICAGGAADPAHLEQLVEKGVDHTFITAYEPELDQAKRNLAEIAKVVEPFR